VGQGGPAEATGSAAATTDDIAGDVEAALADMEVEGAGAGPSSAAEGRADEAESGRGVEISDERLEELREELAEADFFMAQDLHSDALEMLEDLKSSFGEHPELLKKIADVEQAMGGGGAQEVLEPEPAEEPDASEPLPFAEEDEDTAVSIAKEAPPRAAADDPEPEPAEENPLASLQDRDAQVFQQFRDGVAKQVGDEDADTHFDLGIAYKEMGMVRDAMEEFRKAMQSPDREVQARMMLAVCHIEVGELSGAIGEYKRALHSEHITDVETLDAYYQLGNAYEKLEDYAESIYYMEKVEKRQPDYRDVSERLDRLRALGD
jgi:tetratricopeptide (TPR) repeat protein